MIRIKDFAKICGCSLYTLRYYDEMGILKPIDIDIESGYRFYSENQLEDYIRIKQFQEIGFTIKEIKSTFHKEDHEIVEMILNKIEYHKELLDKAYLLKEKYLKGREVYEKSY